MHGWLACRSAAVLFVVLGLLGLGHAPGADARGTPPGALVVSPAQLPPEARQTIARIRSGGPFPFERDGVVFHNRERLLPQQARGYYREYTVITPGLTHRGARRLVAGRAGELFYTDDHYRSFRRVLE